MDNVTDRTARFGLDTFWLLRSPAPAAQAVETEAEAEQDEGLMALGRDWYEVSVRLGAVRWYAR